MAGHSTSKRGYYFTNIKRKISFVFLVVFRLRAVPLQSVESKLGRTGEGEMAERETGERRKEEGLHSLLSPTRSNFSAAPASENWIG